MYGTAAGRRELEAETEERGVAAPVPGELMEEKGDESIEEKGEEDEKVEVEHEMRQPKAGTRPTLPTKAELEAHLPLHLEYRS